MNDHHFSMKTGELARFISVIVGGAWWYPTTFGGSSTFGYAADPHLLPAICLVIAASLILAARAKPHIHTAEAIIHPTLKTVLIWNLALVGMTGAFWWIASPVLFSDGTYDCTFFFGSIGFVALFTYIATMNAIITWHALINVRHAMRRDYAKAGRAAILPVFSFLFVFWFGVYDSWEGWHLRLYWDDYRAVAHMDSGQLYEMSPDPRFERGSHILVPPIQLPNAYQHLAEDGIFYSNGETFFYAWYSNEDAMRGIRYSTRHDRCYVPTRPVNHYKCVEIRTNWYRFIVF